MTVGATSCRVGTSTFAGGAETGAFGTAAEFRISDIELLTPSVIALTSASTVFMVRPALGSAASTARLSIGNFRLAMPCNSWPFAFGSAVRCSCACTGSSWSLMKAALAASKAATFVSLTPLARSTAGACARKCRHVATIWTPCASGVGNSPATGIERSATLGCQAVSPYWYTENAKPPADDNTKTPVAIAARLSFFLPLGSCSGWKKN